MTTIKELIPKIKSESERLGLSIRATCAILTEGTQIKSESLKKAFQRSKQGTDRPHQNMTFSEKEEKIICSLALYLASRGMPLQKSMLLSLEKKVFEKSEEWSGDGWF